MIARLAALRKHPAVFRHLTRLTVPAFDALAADVAPAVGAAPPPPVTRRAGPPAGHRGRWGVRTDDRRPSAVGRGVAAAVPDPGGPRVPVRGERLDRPPGRPPVPAGPGAGGAGHHADAR